MNSKISQKTTHSQTVKIFLQFLAKNKRVVQEDRRLKIELSKLSSYLFTMENKDWDNKSKAASKKLSGMTEEERTILLMAPEEKAFFLEYKKNNPENPWGYFKKYQKKVQDDYKKTQMETAKG